MKRVPRRIFTEEFKKEAVRLHKEQGLTRAEVSRNLDLYNRIRRHAKINNQISAQFAQFWQAQHVKNAA